MPTPVTPLRPDGPAIVLYWPEKIACLAAAIGFCHDLILYPQNGLLDALGAGLIACVVTWIVARGLWSMVQEARRH